MSPFVTQYVFITDAHTELDINQLAGAHEVNPLHHTDELKHL